MPTLKSARAAARHPAALTIQLRAWHSYIGMLIAPSVLFFAATGVLQIYGLHEARGDYTPPPLIEKLGRVHKDQTFSAGRHPPPPSAARHDGPAVADDHDHGAAADGQDHDAHDHADHAPKPAVVLLKAFFALVGAALFTSTLLGVWTALRQSPRRRLLIGLLVVGTVIPLALAAMTAG